MPVNRTIFSQILSYVSSYRFNQCVNRYNGNRGMKKFNCWKQFFCMCFAQLTYRESLRDIEVCLKSQSKKLYHMGYDGSISKSTLAYANESRDWRIYADFAQHLIEEARKLYVDDSDFQLDLDHTVYALDSSTIDLCLSLFPWAKFRKHKAAIKLHTLLDLRGAIPTFLIITDGKIHDVNILDVLIPEPGAFYVMDRGYIDFSRLYELKEAGSFFVIRAKKNMRFKRLYSSPIDKICGLRCDQIVKLSGIKSSGDYPDKLRRIKYYDQQTGKHFVFLTNNTQIAAATIAELYKNRWKIELFFKWIKQHLRIKNFYGTSANAVKT